MRVNRSIDDRPETATRDVTATGIVPALSHGRDAGFVSLAAPVAVERSRADAAVPPRHGGASRPLA